MAASTVDEITVRPPWTIAGHRDPKAWYMAMNARGPVHQDERSGIWMFTGWEAVREFLSQPTLWSTAARNETMDESLRIVRLLTSDPPIHRKLRSFFAKAYRPDRIAAIETRTREVCQELIRECVAKGTFDVVDDYAKIMAVITICELLGIPREDDHKILGPISQIKAYLGELIPEDDPRTVRDLLNPGTSIPETMRLIGTFFADLIARKRVQPGDDLISDLARVAPDELEGQLDIPVLLFEQFGAGTNTTVHLFVSLIHELHVQPELCRRVRADRALIAPLIEEALRLHSPLQARPRILTEDTVINGQPVKKGAWALGWIGAANLDPAVFPDPLRFDIDRPRNDHIAFGRNEHFCLGSHLAKMELRNALGAWLDNIGEYEPLTGDEVDWVPDFILHGSDSYRVRVTG